MLLSVDLVTLSIFLPICSINASPLNFLLCGLKCYKNWCFLFLFLSNSVVVVSFFPSFLFNLAEKGDEIHSSHKTNQYSLKSHSFSSQHQASVLTRRDQTKRQSASATVVPASRPSVSTACPARFPSPALVPLFGFPKTCHLGHIFFSLFFILSNSSLF